MTEKQFLNSWSKELSIQTGTPIEDAKEFVLEFYEKAVKFASQHNRSIPDEDGGM